MSKETLAGRMRATADVAEMAKHYDLETTLRGWVDEVDELVAFTARREAALERCRRSHQAMLDKQADALPAHG